MIQILYAVYPRTNAEIWGHLFLFAPPIEAIGAKGDSLPSYINAILVMARYYIPIAYASLEVTLLDATQNK